MNLSASQHLIKSVDESIQHLVFGFVRKEVNDVIDIIYIVVAYYHAIEYFRYYDPKVHKVMDDGLTVGTVGYARNESRSFYGSIVISYGSKGIHEWKLRVLKVGGGRICIGIGAAEPKLIHEFYRDNKEYTHVTCGGWYGDMYIFTGDTVTVTLDMNDKAVTFVTNKASPSHNVHENWRVKPNEEKYKIKEIDVGYSLVAWFTSYDRGKPSISLLSYKYHV